MMFSGAEDWVFWLSVWHILWINGESVCRNEHKPTIDVSTELQADVLLPCIFDPTLLGSDKTADIAAVWSHRNITVENLVEITLQGGVKFWNNRGGRIEASPKLSASGNFSILLQKVQQSDLGLFVCELHNGTNCRLAYQEVVLSKGSHGHSALIQNWPFIAAGGGAVVFTLLVVSLFCVRHACKKSSMESLYANTGYDQRNPGNPKELRTESTKKLQAAGPKQMRAGNQRKASPSKTGVNNKNPKNCRNIYGKSRTAPDGIYMNTPR